MCGIIGVLSRPSTRDGCPSPPRYWPFLDAAVAAEALSTRPPRQPGQVDELLKGVPGVRALLRSVRTGAEHQLPARPARGPCRRGREPDRLRQLARSRPTRTHRRRADRAARRDLGRPPRPSAHRPRGRSARRRDSTVGRHQRLPGDAAGAVGARSAGGARPRLRRPAPVRVEPRAVVGRSHRCSE